MAAGAADARLLRPRQRAGKESIDADQRVSVNLAASGGRAVDRTDALHANRFDLSFCAAPKDADRTCGGIRRDKPRPKLDGRRIKLD